MIFNNNTTSLSRNIPMAEGYDCSYGAALALVESARNDYNMFKAMLDVEAAEMRIRQESANGYVNEAEITALAEAASGGIWNKIKELFTKLIAKIKAIFHTFMSKLNSLFKSDKEMVKKYEKEILRKSNIGNLEVKWRKPTNNSGDFLDKVADRSDITLEDMTKDIYDEDADRRKEKAIKKICDNNNFDYSSLESDIIEHLFEDESTEQIKDIGGIRAIIGYLNDASKEMKKLEQNANKLTNAMSKRINEANKHADDVAKNSKNIPGSADPTTGKSPADLAVDKANHTYEAAVTYQDVMLKVISASNTITKIAYKQNKAAFMKAIAANDKKLEESTLLDAIAEGAEEEVEDVIDCSISKGPDMMDTNNATSTLISAEVESKDPDSLSYARDKEYEPAKVSGSIGSDYTSRESAFFSQPLY